MIDRRAKWEADLGALMLDRYGISWDYLMDLRRAEVDTLFKSKETPERAAGVLARRYKLERLESSL
jgi:hypothetical protein